MHAKGWQPMTSWLLFPVNYTCTRDCCGPNAPVPAVNEPVPDEGSCFALPESCDPWLCTHCAGHLWQPHTSLGRGLTD